MTNQYQLTISKEIAPDPVCTDIEDGFDYNNKGSSEGPLENEAYFVPQAYVGNMNSTTSLGYHFDYCDAGLGAKQFRTSSEWLAERHCSGPTDNRYIHTQWYECPYGCDNGVCKSKPQVSCTDSDGGINFDEKGMAQHPDWQNATDYCNTENILWEAFCSENGNYISSTYHTCEFGCQDGACLKQPTNTDVGILYMQMRTNDPGYDKDRIILAGTNFWAGKINLKAEGEPIKITDLKFGAEGILSNPVKNVCLVERQSTSTIKNIACATPNDYGFHDKLNFTNLNYVIPAGEEKTLEIKVDTNNMGDKPGYTANTHDVVVLILTTSSVFAEGINSGKKLHQPNLNGISEKGEIVFDRNLNNVYDENAQVEMVIFTKRFEIAGTKISNVNFANQYAGEFVDTKITGPGEYRLGIFWITGPDSQNTDENGNALKIKLGSLAFDIDKSQTLNFGPATIQKIGGSNGSISLNYLADEKKLTADNLLESLIEDSQIEPGSTAYYVIKAQLTPTDDNDNVMEWIKLSMKNLDGDTNLINNIVWYDGFSNQGFFYLRLDTNQITGPKISE